jgi:hypothetical protein
LAELTTCPLPLQFQLSFLTIRNNEEAKGIDDEQHLYMMTEQLTKKERKDESSDWEQGVKYLFS